MEEDIDNNMPPPIVILSAYSLSENQPGSTTALKVLLEFLELTGNNVEYNDVDYFKLLLTFLQILVL